MAKSGSFGFVEGLASCVGAKPNVPFVRLAKIVFKKCGGEQKTMCRFTRCPIALWSVFFCHLSKWFFVLLKFKNWLVCRLMNGHSTIGNNLLIDPTFSSLHYNYRFIGMLLFLIGRYHKSSKGLRICYGFLMLIFEYSFVVRGL